MTGAEQQVRGILFRAGITVQGDKPYDIQVHDPRFYRRILGGASLAAGESYMDGWWDVADLAEFVAQLLKAELDKIIPFNLEIFWQIFSSWFFNLQSRSRAKQVGERHYDIGNDLYRAMLDSRMTYTCGYWKEAKTLDEAQEAKLDLVCKKIGLKAGDRVLDIGCGWGSFAKYAAEKYGATVVGITVSKEQVELARELCKGLSVEIRLEDYRATADGPYDHVISLGMFEHVGIRNYQTYMEKVHSLLKDDGLFLLHTIGGNESTVAIEPWLDKYIFPNGIIPSIAQIGKSVEKTFVMEDWHNFGADYEKTLLAWFQNFDRAWPELKDSYDQRFYRMWKYYLLVCAGTFRARGSQLWQIVLSKKGVPGGYASVR